MSTPTEIPVSAGNSAPIPPSVAISLDGLGVVSRPHITTIQTVSDDSGDLHHTYFVIGTGGGNTLGVVLDLGQGGDAPDIDADEVFTVSGIEPDDGASLVAEAIASALNGHAEFEATSDGPLVTITGATVGERIPAEDGGTGFTFTDVERGLPLLPMQAIPI